MSDQPPDRLTVEALGTVWTRESRAGKLYQNLGKNGQLRPIKRNHPKRPEGMSARQWKKLRKGNKQP